jgi:hypothetical protein
MDLNECDRKVRATFSIMEYVGSTDELTLESRAKSYLIGCKSY